MKVIKVKYTVQDSYADTNAANIRKVMDALKVNPIDGVTYFCYRMGDGVTFIHMVVARNESAQEKIPELDEFKAFQFALKASKPVRPPKSEEFDLVGAGFEL